MTDLERRLRALHRHMASLEFDVRDLIFGEPAKEDEILRVERDLGLSLPPSFKSILTEVSKHVEFRWFTPDGFDFPDPFVSNFSGDIHWSLDLLKTFQEGRAGWIESVFPNPDDPYDAVWHNKLPFFEVGNGDQIAIDLRPDNYEQIVYLSHDDGEGHGHVLASNFHDLLLRSVPLACPGGEDWQWKEFTNNLSTPIDPECENALAWKGLLRLDQ